MPTQPDENDTSGAIATKKEADRKAAWMRRGGWRTRVVKEPDGWHVYTTDVGSRSNV